MKRTSWRKPKMIAEDNENPQEFPGTVYEAFGVDLTKMAKDGEFDPVIGRDKDLEQVILILGRKTKNNPALIGEPGVGKTAVVEKLAQVMVGPDCPEFLKGKKLISIDMNHVCMPINYLPKLIEEVKEHDLILFMDEAHTMEKKPTREMLKPPLARGLLRMIIASTFGEYQATIEKDGALERRFQKVTVDEPSDAECIEMLNALKDRYGAYHNVEYTPESIDSFLKLSKKYITDRFLPDKAIDLMDESGSKIRVSRTKNPRILELEKRIQEIIEESAKASKNQDFERSAELNQEKKRIEKQLEEMSEDSNEPPVEITKEMVEALVAKRTRIPVETISQEKKTSLKGMEGRLRAKVIGQDEAVTAVSKAIKRVKAGLKDPNRPMGVFLFTGPTGVGKTEFVKALAEELFGSREKMYRLDMSEFSEPHTVSKLFGSPPGYVGYDDANQFTEKIRRNPHTVVLLDEMEKAHPKVWQSWLQVFEDGHMTDGKGRKVNFKETLIIMTSNVGASAWKNSGAKTSSTRPSIGFKKTSDDSVEKENEIKNEVTSELKKTFSPEFLNRIDEILIFKPLGKDQIEGIVELELKKVAKKLEEQGINLTWGPGVKDLLVDKGYDPEYGARPLRRAIQKYIENPLADEIIENDLEGDVKLNYDHHTGKLIINGKPVNESKVNRFKGFLNEGNSVRRGRVLGFDSFFINERSYYSPEPEREVEEDPDVDTEPSPLPVPLPPPMPKRPWGPERPSTDPGIKAIDKMSMTEIKDEIKKIENIIKKYSSEEYEKSNLDLVLSRYNSLLKKLK